MIPIHVVGHVIKDPVSTPTENGRYLWMTVRVHCGYGKKARSHLVQYTFFNEQADRVINGKVKSGSLVEVMGTLNEIGSYIPKDQEEEVLFLKCIGLQWEYVATGTSTKEAGNANGTPAVPPANTQAPPVPAQPRAATPAARRAAAPLPTPAPPAAAPPVQQQAQPDAVLVAAAAAANAPTPASLPDQYDADLGPTDDLPFDL